MNMKAIYASAGAIVALAIVIFLMMSTGIFSIGNSNNGQKGIKQNTVNDTQPIKLSIKNVIVNQINNKTANVQVVFDAYNPNRGTAILEAIEYNLFVDGKRISSGDIGNKLEGFLTSSAGIYPIIGNSTVTLKDKQLSQRNNSTANSWDKMVEGKANYMITGTYSYKEISSLQATAADKDFRLTFH